MASIPPWARGVVQVSAPLAAVIAIAVLCLPLTPPYDLRVFLHAGSAVLHGRDFYPRIGTAAVYSGFSFVYPSLAVAPFVPLASLPAHLSTDLFFIASAAAVIAATLVAGNWDPVKTLLVLATAFTITGLQLGALSPLLFAGAVFLWALRDRPASFALVAAPVVVSKLFLAPLLVWPVIVRRYRPFALSAGLVAMLLGLGFVLGPLGLSQYVRLLRTLSVHEAGAGFGLIGVLRNEGWTPIAAQTLAAGLAVVLLAGAFAHHRRSGDERLVYCTGVVVSLLLSPVVWSHYLILLLAIPLVLGAARRWFVALALVSWIIAPPHGLHWELPVPERLESYGPWLALITLAALFAFAAARANP
jgi:alpha-1,2-mannosyltransferase